MCGWMSLFFTSLRDLLLSIHINIIILYSLKIILIEVGTPVGKLGSSLPFQSRK